MMGGLLLADDLKDQTKDDRNRSTLAQTWARYFSENLKASIQAVSVLPVDESTWERNMIHKSYVKLLKQSKYKAMAQSKLQKLAKKLRARSVFLTGSPTEELLKLASPKRFDMIVMGTHGYTGLKRMYLGSVAEEVARRSGVPICLLGPMAQKAGAVPPKKQINIVLASDLGKGSRAAEKYAIRLAKKLKGRITLVHCAYQGQDPMLQMALNTSEGQRSVGRLFEQLIKSSRQHIHRRQKYIESQGVECDAVLDRKFIYPFRSVLNAIESKGGDIVVMGTHGRTLLSQAFFGSTARQTVLRAKVPVLIIRS